MITPQRADYAAAIFPDRHRVCGVRMLPLTLGHALLLQRIPSPYALGNDPRKAGLGDTVLAAYVCSRPWRRAALGVNAVWIKGWIRWRSWRRWHREVNDHIALLGYLSAAWSIPTVFGRQRGGVERGSDAIQIQVSVQRKLWGKSLEAALDTPVAEALLDQMERLEEDGVLRIWGNRDGALLAKLNEIEARQATTPNPDN